MNKKLIIIIALAGLISFGGTFAFGLLTRKHAPAPQAANHPTDVNAQMALKLAQPQITAPVEVDNKKKVAMTEKQLKDLIYEVREKISEYDYKLQELELREKNLQAAKDSLKNDINDLDNLRIELTTTIASIKTEQDKLNKTMIEISTTEETNLKAIAMSYDKMDATQAGKILSSMKQTTGSGANDAVKILYYMTERTKAKVLAAMAETEPAVSADFCLKLKKISVKGQ